MRWRVTSSLRGQAIHEFPAPFGQRGELGTGVHLDPGGVASILGRAAPRRGACPISEKPHMHGSSAAASSAKSPVAATRSRKSV